MDEADALAQLVRVVHDGGIADADASVFVGGLHDQREVQAFFEDQAVGDPEDLVSRREDAVGGQDFLHAGFVQRRPEGERTGTGVRNFQQIIQSGDVHFLQRFVLDAFHDIEDQIRVFAAEVFDEAEDIAVDIENRGFVAERVEGLFYVLHLFHHAHFGEIHLGAIGHVCRLREAAPGRGPR